MEEVGNYRPNCTLPALYKLFSTIIFNRHHNRLAEAQSEDKGEFGRSYQKCREWGFKMWVTTVDIMKEFDSVSHQSL